MMIIIVKYLFLKKISTTLEAIINQYTQKFWINSKIIQNQDITDITDNYYKNDKPCIIKYCTISLIDHDNHKKIFISEKNMYFISCVGDDDDYDDCDELVYYNKPLNDFECLVSVRNNTVNLINNDNYKYNTTLLVDDFRIFICEKWYILN